ncbi:4Fe-4S ferredoxin [Spirochaetia bacterium]|nr:4Fe-4S ferredoxin [Spirochaetia bacterium]
MAGEYTIQLDSSGCKACGYCSLVCPQEVYQQGKDLNRRGYQFFYAANPSACLGCMRCFYVCPDFCLDVIPKETHEKVV